jgi:hypothetical protein
MYTMPLQSVLETGTFFEVESDGKSVWYTLPTKAEIQASREAKQAAADALEAAQVEDAGMLRDLSVCVCVLACDVDHSWLFTSVFRLTRVPHALRIPGRQQSF